jgi:hypothetical protein
MGAEQLLSAAGHGDAAIHEAIDAIVRAAESSVSPQPASGRESPVAVPSAEPEPEAEPEPAVEPEAEAEPSTETAEEDTADSAPEEERP